MKSQQLAQLQFDRFKNNAAVFTPTELMMLYAEIGQRTIYGKNYVPFRGDIRTSKYYKLFVKLRKYMSDEGINPRLYFQSLFDYALAKRQRVASSPRMYDPNFVATLWRPWPSLLMTPVYRQIFEEWTKRGGSVDAFTQYQHEDMGSIRGSISPLPRKDRIMHAVKQTSALVKDFPKLYPGLRTQAVLGIVFSELSAHYLFFMPEAQQLITKGAGSTTQRRVFTQLREAAKVRAKYQRLFDDLTDPPARKRVQGKS